MILQPYLTQKFGKSISWLYCSMALPHLSSSTSPYISCIFITVRSAVSTSVQNRTSWSLQNLSKHYYNAKQSTTFWLIVPASPHSTILIAVISADCGEDADTWRTIVSPRSVVICTSKNSIQFSPYNLYVMIVVTFDSFTFPKVWITNCCFDRM